MLTIFSVPRPFNGHIGLIQENAIASWKILKNNPQVILLANESGTAEVCKKYNVDFIPDVKLNSFGTPLVNDVFRKAQGAAQFEIVAYVNSDIILTNSFIDATMKASKQFQSFLLVGRRYDLSITKKVDFSNSMWEQIIRDRVKKESSLHSPTGMDYQVFRRGAWMNMPPFIVGRPVWDCWFVTQAKKVKHEVIDTTEAVFIIHQKHDYKRAEDGSILVRTGPEALRNRELAEGKNKETIYINSTRDADSRMLRNGEIVQNHMKISFIMIVLNGMPFIEAVLKSIYEKAYEIIIIEGAVEKALIKVEGVPKRTIFGENDGGHSADGTIDFIKKYPDPDEKIIFISGSWPEKCEMQNRGLRVSRGDYVWLVDSDEVYKKKDIKAIIKMLEKDPSITEIDLPAIHFWKGFNYILSSKILKSRAYRRIFKVSKPCYFTTHRPPTLLWEQQKKTTDKMNLLESSVLERKEIYMYHYSYVLEEQVKQKIMLYKRYGWDKSWRINLDNWYSNCFLKWTPKNRETVDKKYSIWTCDPKSRTEKFSGSHPNSMLDIIRKYEDSNR